MPGLVQGPGHRAASKVNMASALSSLTFYGGRQDNQQTCTDSMEKNRSEEQMVH